MKRKLQVLLLSLTLFLPVTLTVGTAPVSAAVDVFPICASGTAATTDVCKSKASTGNPIIHIIKLAITIVSIIIGVAAVIMIILAGFAMVTSNGDPQAIAKARSSIVYALIGLIVAALAEIIVAFVLNKL